MQAPNGASFVIVDKYINPRDGSAALLIQGDPSSSYKLQDAYDTLLLIWLYENAKLYEYNICMLTVPR